MHSNPNTTAAAAHRAAAANATATERAADLTALLAESDATMHRGARLSASIHRDPLMADLIQAAAREPRPATEHLDQSQIERSEYFQHREFGTPGWTSKTPYLPATARWEAAEPNGRGILNSASDEHRALLDLLEAAAIIRRQSTEVWREDHNGDAAKTMSHARMVLKAQVKRLVMEQDWLLDHLIETAIQGTMKQEAR